MIFRYIVDGKNITNRNIGAVAMSGELEWLIEESKSRLDFKEYTKMYVAKGELVARSWTGMEYIVDISNGHTDPYRVVR